MSNVDSANLEHITLRTFREAMKKLDDRQLVSMVQQLVDERDALLKRQEHMVSLSKLWEKTIAEAEIIANQVKEEAKKEAEDDKNRILDEARSVAEKQLKEHLTNSNNPTKEGIQSVKQKWQQEFAVISENSIKTLESRFAETAQQISDTCATHIEILKKQSEIFRKDLEKNLPEFGEPVLTPASNTNNLPGQQTNQAVNPANQPAVKDSVVATLNKGENEQSDIREQRVIEILPPRDKERIDHVRNHLNFYEEVLQTEIQHQVDRTFIVVYLSKPLDLVKTMSDWPEVEHAQEVVSGNQTRIQISLGVEKEIAQEKDKLTSKLSRFTHNIKSR